MPPPRRTIPAVVTASRHHRAQMRQARWLAVLAAAVAVAVAVVPMLLR